LLSSVTVTVAMISDVDRATQKRLIPTEDENFLEQISYSPVLY